MCFRNVFYLLRRNTWLCFAGILAISSVDCSGVRKRLPLRLETDVWECRPIKLDFCKDIGYNKTIVMSSIQSNPYTSKNSQEESNNELRQFLPLIETGCSKDLRLLLCSVYLPYCDPKHNKGIVSCRPLCEDVKSKCEKHLKDLFLSWPHNLECSSFLERNTGDKFCVPGDQPPTYNKTSTRKPYPVSGTTKSSKSNRPLIVTDSPHNNHDGKRNKVTSPISKENYCKLLYSRNVKNYIYVEKVQSCALECMKDGLFSIDQKQLAERWISGLACVCGILCFASILCVMSNYSETTFPERTIFFIAVCYFFYVVGYIVRIVCSREGVTCQKEKERHYLLVDGSGNMSCAATFLLSYFFSMAQSIWWVILCLTWFLSAGMRWTTKAIHSKSFWYHTAAWIVPLCKTIAVLVWRKIDVNELTGVCSIGNRYENLRALRYLVLGPLFCYLIMASMFLFFGLTCIFRLPVNKQEGQLIERKKSQQLLLPIGSYAALHTLFSTFILASYFYEYVNKNNWYHDPKSIGPNFAVFLTRIISDFSIGISASIWLLLMHGPRSHRKVKDKLYQTELLLARDPALRIPAEGSNHYTSTNETSI